MRDIRRRAYRLLWHPIPFIPERAATRIFWFMPLIAFLLFILLVASLSAVR